MTAALLSALLVVLLGGRFRVRPMPRGFTGTTTATTPRRMGFRRLGSRPRATSRRRASPVGETAAWCGALAQAVRGGSSLPEAVRGVAPPASATPTVEQIVLRLERGAPLTEAVMIDVADEHLALVLTVLRACAEHGGPPAQPLDRAASALRDRAADLAEREIHSGQARLSARVMTVLPLAMLLVLVVTAPTVRSIVVSPMGALVVVAGGALNLAGWRWMSRVIWRSRP